MPTVAPEPALEPAPRVVRQHSSRGPAHLLGALVASGLDPGAVVSAAALIVALDDAARVDQERRRERARAGAYGRWRRAHERLRSAS